MLLLRSTFFALLFALAACAQGSTDRQGLVRAPAPPADYVYLGGADLSHDKNIDIQANTDLMMSGDPDANIPMFFGLHFMSAMSAAPAKREASGSGSRADDPIILKEAVAKTELDAIGSHLVATFPDRDKIIGELYRSPAGRYVLWLGFVTADGPRALYFDASGWVATHRKSYSG